MLSTLTGDLHGQADDRLSAAIAPLVSALRNDPVYSFQAVAYHHGSCVLDVWGGPHMDADSLIVPASVTKSTIGFAVALLGSCGSFGMRPEPGRLGASRKLSARARSCEPWWDGRADRSSVCPICTDAHSDQQ